MEYNHLLKTNEDYEQALARIDELFDAKPGTKDADELELLVALVELYEQNLYHIDPPNPIDAIKYRMEQEGLTNTDMEEYLGSKSKVSEVFSGKRGLSLTMIRKLSSGLNIPADVLISCPVRVSAQQNQ
jgi:HTH-type transcriptional regulator / antitoxin HigA